MINCVVLLTISKLSILSLETHIICREEGMTPTEPSLHTFYKGLLKGKHSDRRHHHTHGECLQQVSGLCGQHLDIKSQKRSLVVWKHLSTVVRRLGVGLKLSEKVGLNIKGFNFVSSSLTPTMSCI